MSTLQLHVNKRLKVATASFKGKRIRAVKGGYQIVGDTKVYKTLTSLTDTLR